MSSATPPDQSQPASCTRTHSRSGRPASGQCSARAPPGASSRSCGVRYGVLVYAASLYAEWESPGADGADKHVHGASKAHHVKQDQARRDGAMFAAAVRQVEHISGGMHSL